MNIKHIFAFLRRPVGLPEQRAAVQSIEETRAQVGARALQAAQNANGSSAVRLLGSVEQQIGGAYAETASRIEALFSPSISRLQARLEHLLSHTAPERLDAVERECSVERARREAQYRPKLVSARRTERGKWRRLRAFCVEHQLAREAHYPQSRTLYFGALAFVWLLEAIANSWAFAQGSAMGLLGGLSQAMLVAGINLAFAFFAGRAASGLFHRQWRVKSLSVSLVGAWVVFEALFSLTVAHYRIALLDNVDTAPWVAMERLQTLPLAIDDVTSVMLTLFTVAFGVVALFTGLATDDRYPGFGAKTRTHVRARQALEVLRAHYLGAIDATFLPAQARVNAIAVRAAEVTADYSQTVGKLKELTSALNYVLDEVAAAHRKTVLDARETFTVVSGQVCTEDEPARLVSNALLSHARQAIADAEETLATVPARVARLERQRTAAETRLQRQHAETLEAAPAFFGQTEALAEQEVDHDVLDPVLTSQRQQQLWEAMSDDSAATAPTDEAEVDGQSHPAILVHKGNGCSHPDRNAH